MFCHQTQWRRNHRLSLAAFSSETSHCQWQMTPTHWEHSSDKTKQDSQTRITSFEFKSSVTLWGKDCIFIIWCLKRSSPHQGASCTRRRHWSPKLNPSAHWSGFICRNLWSRSVLVTAFGLECLACWGRLAMTSTTGGHPADFKGNQTWIHSCQISLLCVCLCLCVCFCVGVNELWITLNAVTLKYHKQVSFLHCWQW